MMQLVVQRFVAVVQDWCGDGGCAHSPAFCIMNDHFGKRGFTLSHFDTVH